ncbi:MAG: DciA family protein [Propionibacteriaceae bacterium]|nr:DciA family protein [Propionibacteriaceae bacterium]
MNDHDPTGLELAHQIASRAKGNPARINAKKAKKRNPGDPVRLDAALAEVVEEQGWGTNLGIHQLLLRWDDLVGPINAQHAKPESYQDTVLTILADSTAWASSLRMIAPQIVAVLNDRLGQGSVSRIIVKGPEAPSWRKGPRVVPGRGPRDTYG